MELQSIRCALQVALLGAITSNIRSIRVTFSDAFINIYIYYDKSPSEEEEELSEIVSSEVMAYYANVMVEVHRNVIPEPQQIPEISKDEIWVYSRWEKT